MRVICAGATELVVIQIRRARSCIASISGRRGDGGQALEVIVTVGCRVPTLIGHAGQCAVVVIAVLDKIARASSRIEGVGYFGQLATVVVFVVGRGVCVSRA